MLLRRLMELDLWNAEPWNASPDELKELQMNLLTMRSYMVINMDRLKKASHIEGAQAEWEVMSDVVERVDARLSQVAKYLDADDSQIIQEMMEANDPPEESDPMGLGKTGAQKLSLWARLFRWFRP